ncbi:hypothetical protein ADIARSV_3057 [Arcticibacter svalbardensis MN12-7]|uniref:Uncharacterized protein n=1 Tax=Arcticibacter svalbardensis MN12-7 TaxID=1150600 RepID=R9GXW8_9SPHI|nr:hypothetical protein ADIARSV_3057 [Arcticibacter svalbardensis MN12-7]
MKKYYKFNRFKSQQKRQLINYLYYELQKSNRTKYLKV